MELTVQVVTSPTPPPPCSCRLSRQGQANEFVVSPRKASGAPITDVTAASAFAAEGSTYSFAGGCCSTTALVLIGDSCCRSAAALNVASKMSVAAAVFQEYNDAFEFLRTLHNNLPCPQ